MSDTCEAPFEFFLHVTTICGRPKGHAGDHHPIRLACDDSPLTSSPAVTTPAGEAARPGPPRHGNERGPGRASNFPC